MSACVRLRSLAWHVDEIFRLRLRPKNINAQKKLVKIVYVLSCLVIVATVAECDFSHDPPKFLAFLPRTAAHLMRIDALVKRNCLLHRTGPCEDD